MSSSKKEQNRFRVSDELYRAARERGCAMFLLGIESQIYFNNEDMVVKLLNEYYEWLGRDGKVF